MIRPTVCRHVRLLLAGCAAALACAGCGGGSGSASGTAPVIGSAPAPQSAAVAPTPMIGDANVVRVYIDGGPTRGYNAPNALYADVVICAPGTDSCVTVDHMRVDTGSAGVRVYASVLPPGLVAALPQQVVDTGQLAGECLGFVSGATWGGVRRVDIGIGGRSDAAKAANIPIQVMGDPEPRVSVTPSDCTGQGEIFESVQSLSAKGVLGIGLHRNDCGTGCELFHRPVYFGCAAAGACVSSSMKQVNQIVNPIAALAIHNNGHSIVLPPLTGPELMAEGMLILGIGTAANNGMVAAAQPLVIDGDGQFTSKFNGGILKYSFIDSGSSFNFFPEQGTLKIPRCSRYTSFYCPTPALSMTAENTGLAQTKSLADIFVAHADQAFIEHAGTTAIPGLASAAWGGSTLDLGASFFFGRQVYTLMQDKVAVGFPAPGPAWAHTP